MGIGLSILFTGLCALVTDDAGRSGQVILVDSRGLGVVGGATLPEHTPTLVMDLNGLVNPETSGPDRVVAGWPGSQSVGEVGLWDLTGSEVRVRVQGSDGSPLSLFTPQDGESSWPEAPHKGDDSASWRDIRFVADMASVVGDGRINPELLSDAAGTMPRGIAARIHLDGGLVEAGLPSREEYRGEVYEFASNGNSGALRQALTDTIRWSLQAPTDAVIIEIAPVVGGPVRRLCLKPQETTHQVFVGNLPVQDGRAHSHAFSEEAAAALHFGAYYELLLHRPDTRPMPKLLLPNERRSAGVWHGPFCPPARFRSN